MIMIDARPCIFGNSNMHPITSIWYNLLVTYYLWNSFISTHKYKRKRLKKTTTVFVTTNCPWFRGHLQPIPLCLSPFFPVSFSPCLSFPPQHLTFAILSIRSSLDLFSPTNLYCSPSAPRHSVRLHWPGVNVQHLKSSLTLDTLISLVSPLFLSRSLLPEVITISMETLKWTWKHVTFHPKIKKKRK